MTREEAEAETLRDIEEAVDRLRAQLESARRAVDHAIRAAASIHVGSPGVETVLAVQTAQGLFRVGCDVNARATEVGGLAETLSLIRSLQEDLPCPSPNPSAAR